MTRQTYYDSQLRPIIRETESNDFWNDPLPKLKIRSVTLGKETAEIDVSVEQLKGILKVLNTTL